MEAIATKLPSLSPAAYASSAGSLQNSNQLGVSNVKCNIHQSTTLRLKAVGKSSLCWKQAKEQKKCHLLLPLQASPVSSPPIVSEDGEKIEGRIGDEPNSLTPSSFEVQSFLMEVCDETSIAELKLKVGGFKLHMKRDIGKNKEVTMPMTAAPEIPSKSMVDSLSASLPTQPLKLPEMAAMPASKIGLLKTAADEGLSFVTSPKVGIFRRSRNVKGKSGPPLCEEGQKIKQGQVACYVEQLGTGEPVECNVSGEVMKILWEDGEPVGYGDPLISIRPSFPGIN